MKGHIGVQRSRGGFESVGACVRRAHARTSAQRPIGDFRRRGAENARTAQYHDRAQNTVPHASRVHFQHTHRRAVDIIIFLFES